MDENDREMLSIELAQLNGEPTNHEEAPAEETFEARERFAKRLRRTVRQASVEKQQSGR